MRKTVFGIRPSAQCFILFGFGQEFSFSASLVFMFRVESPRPRREHRPNCTKRPRHERKLHPRSDPAARHALREGSSTRDAASGGTEVTPALRSRGGHYHKSPNDATLQLCTPKRELEQFVHPPLLAANYINANISGVL